MSTDTDLAALYFRQIELSIDQKGVHPMPALFQDADSRLTMASLAVEPQDVFGAVAKIARESNAQEIIFGKDRYAKPGQGIETADFVTVYHWRRDAAPALRLGVLVYQHEPRIVRPIDWEHPYWGPIMASEPHDWFPRENGPR